jgi:hypothetical protein
MKNKNCLHIWVHTSKDTWHLEARGLSDCVESVCRDWNHARKYTKFSTAGWRRIWISAPDSGRNCYSDIFLLIFINTNYIIKISMYLLTQLLSFKAMFYFINTDYSLIRITYPHQLIRISESLLYIQTHSIMEGIYEVRRWDGLRYHDTYTKFHKDWFRHSKVNRKGYTDTQTAWK